MIAMTRWFVAMVVSWIAGAVSAASIVTTVTARQVQPWNGLVEITVGLSCESNDLVVVFCTFAATNSATRAALPVLHVRHVGRDTGSEREWQRHFIWDAAADLGEAKIDDVALTVDAQGPVQLWENGPYWAPCNVGATKPEEYGYCFWWGDTVGYKRNSADYGWVSVEDGSSFSFSSRNCPTYLNDNSMLQVLGYIDTAGNLATSYDAATAHLGVPWRMPTDAEFSALISNCTTTWTMRNGVYGRLVTGKGVYASKSIFLPAAGYGKGDDFCYLRGLDGYYWSSTPNSGRTGDAWCLYVNSVNFCQDSYFVERYCGRSVRPLREFAQ